MKSLADLRTHYWRLKTAYPHSDHNRTYLLLCSSHATEEAIARMEKVLTRTRKDYRRYYDFDLIAQEVDIVDFLNYATETENYETELSAIQLTFDGEYEVVVGERTDR